MPDTFALTIIVIVAVALIGMFVRGRMRDRCLRHFEGNRVTLKLKDGKLIKGVLKVESTGIEIVHDASRVENGFPVASYIFYKPEFVHIEAILRSEDDLEIEIAERRKRIMQEIRIPGSHRRLGRRLGNFVNTVRDSMTEIFNLFMGKVKTMPAGGMIASQQKYISQTQAQLTSTETAFEPLLEKHIGENVIVEIKKGDKLEKFSGLLRDYTAEFVEIMDADYRGEGELARRLDLIVPRHCAIVRHIQTK